MLEDILSLRIAERHPLATFIMGALATIASFFVAYFFFPSSSGLILVFLITIAMVPLFHLALQYEELKDEFDRKLNFFQRHADIIQMYTSFFFGVAVTTSLLTFLLPHEMVSAVLSDQIIELEVVQSGFSGRFFESGLYSEIVANNMKILLIAFVLSFVFGTGALFVLSWNATILGVLVSTVAKSIGIHGIGVGFLTFLPHGILEIGGFFMAGIAAGILSESAFHVKSESFKYVMKDGIIIFVISIGLILLAALVETGLM